MWTPPSSVLIVCATLTLAAVSAVGAAGQCHLTLGRSITGPPNQGLSLETIAGVVVLSFGDNTAVPQGTAGQQSATFFPGMEVEPPSTIVLALSTAGIAPVGLRGYATIDYRR